MPWAEPLRRRRADRPYVDAQDERMRMVSFPDDLRGRAVARDDEADRHRWLAYHRFFSLGDGEAPLALQWLMFAGIPERTREDGHAETMSPFPPLPYPRRMWAGGEVRWLSPIACGEPLTRRSTIVKAEPKSGAAGDFLLTALDHEIAGPAGVRIRERQDIVFLPAATTPGSASRKPADFEPDWREERLFGPVDLFRYSALTLNGHRIHYDDAYAREREHYPALVVHGPLLASHLIHASARRRPNATPVRFAYRAVSPSFVGQSLAIIGSTDGVDEDLAFLGPDGGVRMIATMTFA